MTVTSRMRILALAAMAPIVASCSADAPSAPQSSKPADLTAVFSQMLLSPATSSAIALAGAPVVPSSVLLSSCTYGTSTQSFTCTATANGLTYTQTYMLLDASNAPQPLFNASTTASVRTSTIVTGTVTSSAGAMQIDMHQDLVMTGLLTGARVLNGTTTLKENGTFAVGTTSQSMATDLTQNIINVTPPPATSIYPASGSVVIDAKTTIASLPAVASHVEVTFSGGSSVGMTMRLNGGAPLRCTVDVGNVSATVCVP